MNQILVTTDGSHTLESEKFGVSYHSKYGAIQESLHVFIRAALRPKAIEKKDIRILEAGFGTGLNAYLSLIEASKLGLNIQFSSLEAYPIDLSVAKQLNYPKVIKANPELTKAFYQMHECSWGTPTKILSNFELTKLKQKFEDAIFDSSFDIVYFDAFAPGSQPELWEEKVLGNMYNALVPGGVLSTYCAKGAVKRQLKSLGFEIKALPGPPGKREMTLAIKPRT